MERELSDEKVLSPEAINEMEEKRIEELNRAGVDEQAVLSQANKHLNTWNSYFQENITRGKDDMNFVLRDQWTAIERSEFTRLFKPAMTFNKLKGDVRKIVGEQRKNKPDLIVRSLTGKATQQQINLRADLVRTISYQSQNDLVYQTAFKSSLQMGFGAFQILLDYESPMSFNKIIRYDLIPDPTRTSFDPTALKPHKGDGNYCARYYVFTRDEFFATYPYVTNPVSYIDPYMLLDFQWQTRDTITVCDYFVKEWYPMVLYKLSDGRSVTEEQWAKIQKQMKQAREITQGAEVDSMVKDMTPTIVQQRQTQNYRIMHYRLIRDQIIEFSEWPSRHLPIIFVDGDSSFIEGRQYTSSFIHEARDAQKLLNYSRSETAAELKNRRREQWVGTPDNIIGYEQQWRNPELQAGILMAKPDPKTGQMPQKMNAWEISQGLFATAQACTQDMNEILGISESDMMMGKDISGKARRERKLETAMSSYIFMDNLNQAVEQGGRVVNDLLPYVAGDDERHMTISKKDGKTESIILNEMMKDGTKKNVIEEGDYDVEIDAGPSFAVQKEVALEFLQQTLQAFPQAFPLVADLWAKNLDVQFMPQMADRFKTLVPPDILAKEDNKPPPPPPPPSPEEQMMQMQMQEQQQKMQANQQKMQIEEQQLMERAEELRIRKEKHQLEQAEMILKAQEMSSKNALAHKGHEIDMARADMDFTAKIASVLASAHKEPKVNNASNPRKSME